MAADSLSFFENNFEHYYNKHGEEKAKKKIKFMYNRMSKTAQKFVKNFKYQNPELNLIFKEKILKT